MSTLLAAVVLMSIGLWSGWRGLRAAGWRDARAWAPPLLAALLWAVLYPPGPRLRSDALLVLTPGASAQQLASLPRELPRVRLPDAPMLTDAEDVPDLGTALRRHAEVRALHIVGTGLAARDREALPADIALIFDAAPLHGLVELQAPATVRSGARWSLSGRLAAPAARVELRDPADAVVATADAQADGAFSLAAAARGAGPVRYRLRALDAGGAAIDEAVVPLRVLPGIALRVGIRAGSPDPDLKYLRRWAEDAGLQVAVQAGLSERVSQHLGELALDASALAQTDVLIVDERAWQPLADADKRAIRAAVDAGMGLLLRVTGPVPDAVLADWRSYGFGLQSQDGATSKLEKVLDSETVREAQRAPLHAQSQDAQTLLADDDGAPLALWRAQGRGRVGLWLWLDDYRLVLAGDAPLHGSLWARMLGALARPHDEAPLPAVPLDARVDRRSTRCGRLRDEDASENAGAAQGCVAWWPAQAGWHWLDGPAPAPFYVRGADEDRGLLAAADQRATQRLQRAPDGAPVFGARSAGPRWPWALAWLLLAAALWWRERRDWGD